MTQRMRLLLLLLLLDMSSAAYYWVNVHGGLSQFPPGPVATGTRNQKPRSREMEKLPPKVLEDLRRYVQDVNIGTEQNNLDFAIQLDSQQAACLVTGGRSFGLRNLPESPGDQLQAR